MKLFYVMADDHDGESRNVFVRSETPEQAVDHLLAYYEIEREDLDGEVNVLEVPSLEGDPGAISWQSLFDTETVL